MNNFQKGFASAAVIIVVAAIIVGVGAIVYLQTNQNPDGKLCGNGECDAGEKGFSCPKDCSKIPDGGKSVCQATGGVWKYNDCMSACLADTKDERLARFGEPIVCTQECIQGNGCVCPEGQSWASREEGCLLQEVPLAACLGEGVMKELGHDDAADCCSGLSKINYCSDAGECKNAVICTAKCGDGACDDRENKYNCPADCQHSALLDGKASEWKKYSNNFLGFEISYPADFSLTGDVSAGSVVDRAIEIKKPDSGMQIIVNPTITGGGCGMADDFTFAGISDFPQIIKSEKALLIDGQNLKIMYRMLPAGACNDLIPGKCTKKYRMSAYVVSAASKSCLQDFKVGETRYLINFGGEFDANNADGAMVIFEKILSTIKFLIPANTK